MYIEHISISRESLFNECKYKYRLKYHLKTPSPVPEQEYFIYGKIIHKIIEVYTINRGLIDISDVVKTVLQDYDPLTPYYKIRLPQDIGQFMCLTKRIGTSGIVEHTFKKDLDTPNNKFILGVMDRIIEKDGRYYIFDYKTTKQGIYRKTDQTIINDLQLQCYAWVVSEMYSVPADKIKASLFYLQDGKMVSAQFSTQTLEYTPKRLLKIYNEIMESDADTVIGTTGQHCIRCEYSSICPFYNVIKHQLR